MHIEVICRKPSINTKPKVPILCVHGGFHGAWCWDEYFLPYFAEAGFEAHALSLRGHGKSDGREAINRWGITDYANDVAMIAAQLSAAPVVIGHSLGGIVVQEYLKQHRVSAAILLASSPYGGILVKASFKHLLPNPLRLTKLMLTHNMLHIRPISESLFFSDDVSIERQKDYSKRFDNESFRVFNEALKFKPPKPSEIDTPLLVMAAERDKAVPAKANELLAAYYHTTVETFPMSHDMMLESNWKQVAHRIVAWIESRVSPLNEKC